MALPLLPVALTFQLLTVPCVHKEAPPPDEAERRAVAALERVGASVHRATMPDGTPTNMVLFHRLRADEDLDLAFGLPFLHYLGVQEGNLTDAGMERISRLSALTFLNLQRVPLTDSGLAHVGSLTQLEHLIVRNAPVTDAGLIPLRRLKNVRRISFSDTEVTDGGVAELREALQYAIITRRESPGEPWMLYGVLAVVVAVAYASIWCGLKGQRSGRRRWTAAAVAGMVAVPAVGLLGLKGMMRPIRDGDAGSFWLTVTGLDVGAKQYSFGGFVRPRDGRFIYYAQGFHGAAIYCVDPDAVRALFPKVVERLRNAPPGRLKPDVEVGFREWEKSGAGPGDVEGLLRKIEDARTGRIRRDNPGRNYSPEEYERIFDEHWRCARRYSWNLWFEFAFLAGLIVFAAWPWLWSAGRARWASHLGLTPTLFCLPYWLGYAPLTFTSAGPTGGVLYPFLLLPLHHLPWSDFDPVLLRALPRPLESLSQVPGAMLSVTRYARVGPVAVLTLGGLVMAAILCGPSLVRWFIRERNKAGTIPPPIAS